MIKFPICLVLACFLAFGTGCQSTTFEKTTKPNLVYIICDDLGYGDVSAFNPEGKIATPNIDRLADEGMMFTDAHTTSSVCTPTRYNVLTGRYNWRTDLKSGVLNGYGPPLIDEDRLTFASLLRDHGYQTAMIGKWHLGMDLPFVDEAGRGKAIDWSRPIGRTPTSNGFDYFWGHGASLDFPPYVYIENNRYTSTNVSVKSKKDLGIDCVFRTGPIADNFDPFTTLDEFCDRSAAYIQDWDGEKPFALYVPLTSPHTPILPTGEWDGKSGINNYVDFVMQTDAGVGKILDALDARGITGNTIVVFTSDNGCSPRADFKTLEAHGHQANGIFRGAKADIWEGGHRVPHIVRWPAKVEPGTRSDRLTLLGDIVATMADIVGADFAPDEAEDSVSFYATLTGQEEDPSTKHQAIINHSVNGTFAVRTKEWKLCFSAGSGGWAEPKDKQALAMGLPKYQLYNMVNDPEESNNLYEKHPEIIEQLTEIGTQIVVNGRSTPGEPQPNDTANDWRQLDWMKDAGQ
ncbi:arylsulfatase [Coraliomargarita sinensis]|uniref:Arylsulfatase n=1 Tax=Coraliomargarita sinensis TaxID=2174842 RepID=A0A317ZEB2_9BACT|nr:arylsulfatase [Coraliomargarita sinensis]PXA03540.1 arylsulfatase [Coraliomargarita sinensis]